MKPSELAVILVVVVAAAWIGVQTWNSFTEDGPDFEYLECVPIEEFGGDITAVGGCAEIVEIGGLRYVKMTDVGEFTVYKGSTGQKYEVGPAHVDLILQAGQSNAYLYTAPGGYPDGHGEDTGQTGGKSPLEPGVAFYIGTEKGTGIFGGLASSSNLADCRVWDMTDGDGNVRIANTYPVFLYDWHEMTGHRVVMINSAVGGRSITYWEPGQSLYTLTKQVTAVTDRLLDTSKFVVTPTAVLWSQGESDASMSADEYKTRLVELMDRFSDGTFIYEFPKLLTTLPRAPGQSNPIGSAAGQMAAAAEDPRIIIATTIALEMPTGQPYYRDSLHYTQMVYSWMGEAFARTLAASYGYGGLPETVVLCDISGTEAPAQTQGYGTSGEQYDITVDWDTSSIDGPGEYEITGVIVATPTGTIAAPGDVARAKINIEEEEE